MSTTSKPAPIMEYIPQYRCPCCEAAVRREHVFIDRHAAKYSLTERRTVTVFCDPCGTVHRTVQKRNVVTTLWEDEGDVERLTGAKELRGVMKRVEKINGDLQRQAS